MKLTIAIVYVSWFLSELILGRLKRSNSSDVRRDDRHSLAVIWIVIGFVMPIASIIPRFMEATIADGRWVSYSGVGLIVVGMALRAWAILSLGRLFTVDVTIREGHVLKTDGLYSIVRHPSYFASWLSFVGYGFAQNNWVSLAVVSVAIMAAFLYRIKIEEELLISQFGDAYLKFRKSTKAIIPGVI